MAEVIQIKCPHCQNSLRIPAGWVNQTMRCKHCQQVFQAKKKAPSTAAAPVPAAAKAAAAKQPAAKNKGEGNPFVFDDASSTPIKVQRTQSQRREPGKLKMVLLGCCLLTVVGITAVGAVVFVGLRVVKELFPDTPTQEVAQNSSKKGGGATVKDTPPDTGKDTAPDPKQDAGTAADTASDPQKDTSSKETKAKDQDPPPMRTQDIYPRRALLISVNDYLLAPPLVYGKPAQGDFKGSTPRAFGDQLIANLDFPRKQVAEVSDKANPPVEPLRSAIEASITEFLKTSRAQDNIVLFFAGHATEIDKEAYLVPKEGKVKDAKTLIPLTWLYKELSECKARQKVLILDVCRFNPGRGVNAEPMGPVLEAKLKQPPPGVQVLACCGAKQQSLETDNGSLFLQALCKRCDGLPTPPEYAIPIKRLAAAVATELEAATLKSSRPQRELIAGNQPVGKGPFNPREQQPPDVVAKAPTQPKGDGDSPLLKAVIAELNLFPPTTGGTAAPLTPALFADVRGKLDKYKADYTSILDYKNKEAEAPLRCHLARGILALQENIAKLMPMRQTIPGAAPDKALKDSVRAEQQRIGKLNFLLRDAMRDLIAAGEKYRDEETQRVQLLFDYTLLRMKARLIYAEEYNFALAEIMKDTVPKLEEGNKVYRLTAQEKVNINEPAVKELVKDLKKGLPQFIKTYADTPWAVMMQREQAVVLGLAWRSAKQ
jgi:hypothetical protein